MLKLLLTVYVEGDCLRRVFVFYPGTICCHHDVFRGNDIGDSPLIGINPYLNKKKRKREGRKERRNDMTGIFGVKEM